MDHRGLRARLTGAGCTSCGAAVSIDRIAILADRGDLAFIELDCAACGSRTMSLVLRDDADAEPPVLDTATDPGPITRALIAGWDGDLRSLLDGRDDAPREPAR